jgi:apolipoprotein N-acyltransferase
MDQATFPRRWYRPLLLTLASGGLLWAAFPPLGIAPLAWIALVPALLLVHDRQPPHRFRWYLLIWLGSSLHWMLLTQGIRLAHWSTHFAWFTLGLYLGLYLPLFIGLTRVAVHCCRWPLMVAAPLIWTGLELVRGHALTGFSMGLLAHTQVDWLALIQLADLVGAYGVSFLVILVNAAIVANPGQQMTRRRWSLQLATALLMVLLAVSYGYFRQTGLVVDDEEGSLKIALLQGSIDTTFDKDPEEFRRTYTTYRRLSIRARQEHPDLDLIVWPESMFPFGPEIIHDKPPVLPDALQIDKQAYLERIKRQEDNFQAALDDLLWLINEDLAGPFQEQLDIQLILGTSVQRVDDPSAPLHNAALWIRPLPEELRELIRKARETPEKEQSEEQKQLLKDNPDGSVAGRYYKSHLVIFGEYVPLADRFPWLYRFVPMSQGVSPGKSPSCFTVNGVRITPSICFESTSPHFMRRQVNRLSDQGTPPDMMINITNDGWFWGSSVLDLHLSCTVFRAVELRMPLLVAANTGLSVVIDSQGRILKQLPRDTEDLLVESVQPGKRFSLYRKTGDLFGIGAALVCLLLAVIGWRNRRAKRHEKGL